MMGFMFIPAFSPGGDRDLSDLERDQRSVTEQCSPTATGRQCWQDRSRCSTSSTQPGRSEARNRPTCTQNFLSGDICETPLWWSITRADVDSFLAWIKNAYRRLKRSKPDIGETDPYHWQ